MIAIVRKTEIELGDKWKRYLPAEPYGVTMLGVVTFRRKANDTTYALGKAKSTGKYICFNADGDSAAVDGRVIAKALRREEMSGSARNTGPVNVYIDEVSIAIATRLGNGNVSKGIRSALFEIAKQLNFQEVEHTEKNPNVIYPVPQD